MDPLIIILILIIIIILFPEDVLMVIMVFWPIFLVFGCIIYGVSTIEIEKQKKENNTLCKIIEIDSENNKPTDTVYVEIQIKDEPSLFKAIEIPDKELENISKNDTVVIINNKIIKIENEK